MKRNFGVVRPLQDLRNVVFIGIPPFDAINYKYVRQEELTEQDKQRLVAYQACKHRYRKAATDCQTYCKNTCIWGIVRMTKEEKIIREEELKGFVFLPD